VSGAVPSKQLIIEMISDLTKPGERANEGKLQVAARIFY
jgi:hypothetical protein